MRPKSLTSSNHVELNSALLSTFKAPRQNVLEKFAEPRISTRSPAYDQLQSEIVDSLTEAAVHNKIGLQKNHLICQFDLKVHNGSLVFEYRPVQSIDGKRLYEDAGLDSHSLEQFASYALSDAGYLDFLKDNCDKLITDKFGLRINISITGYRSSKNNFFHLDSLNTLAVVLSYGNPDAIDGIEYISNPSAMSDYLARIEGNMPDWLFQQLKELAERPCGKTIHATEVPSKGAISFLNLSLAHSTPMQQSRGIRLEDFESSLPKIGKNFEAYRDHFDRLLTEARQKEGGRIYKEDMLQAGIELGAVKSIFEKSGIKFLDEISVITNPETGETIIHPMTQTPEKIKRQMSDILLARTKQGLPSRAASREFMAVAIDFYRRPGHF